MRYKLSRKAVARALQQADSEDDTPLVTEDGETGIDETHEKKVSKPKPKMKTKAIHCLSSVRFDSPHDGLEASRTPPRPTSESFEHTCSPALGTPDPHLRKSLSGRAPVSKHFR
jgi:hypothetical protein